MEKLREIAPVIAIRGNVDTSAWAKALRETEVVQTAGATIYMLHNLAGLDLNPAAAGFHVVLYGHSHKPSRTEKGGVLYINPGSAGPRRFNLPVTVARLDLAASPWNFELVYLDHAKL